MFSWSAGKRGERIAVKMHDYRVTPPPKQPLCDKSTKTKNRGVFQRKLLCLQRMPLFTVSLDRSTHTSTAVAADSALSHKIQQTNIGVDLTAVVVSVAVVAVAGLVAAVLVVFICRGRKRVELNYNSENPDDKVNHSPASSYIVEGVVESVVGDDTVCVDTQSGAGVQKL